MDNTTAAHDAFQEMLLASAAHFASVTSKGLESLFSVRGSLGTAELLEENLGKGRDLFFSILFTGTVFGEFILALNEATALKIAGGGEGDGAKSSEQRLHDAVDGLCELLNVSVGASVGGLSKLYKKITITAPKVHFGQVRYPRVKSAKVALKCDQGDIDCYLYVDRMKLDIAASYKDTLASLLRAHKELLGAMQKLKEQQKLLVQSEKMAALGTMAAGVAHEINTPLAAVSMIGGQLKEMLEDEAINKKSFVEMLEMVERSIVKISRITNSLKTYARGVAWGAFEPVPVKQLLEDALALSEQHLKDRGVEVRLAPIAEDLSVECRQVQLTHVLVNILENAADAVAELGEKWVDIGVQERGDGVEISLRDAGLGIPSEIREKIFDPFFTTKGIGGGTGLGLSVSKGIMDEHFGSIFLDSDSVNTCFVVKIPKLHRRPR